MGWLLLILSLLFSGQLEGQRYYKRPTFAAAATGVCADLVQTSPTLEACWDFIEGPSGTQTLTDKANGFDATRGPTTGSESQDPTWISGDRLDFLDDDDEYVDTGTGAFGGTDLCADGDGSFTVHIVAQDDLVTSGLGTYFAKGGNTGTSATLDLHVDSFDRLHSNIRNSNTDLNFTDTGWHMLTIVCNNGACEYYQDCDGTPTALNEGTASCVSTEFSIGLENGGAGTEGFDGKIALVSIYSGALSSTQVGDNYQAVDDDFNSNRSIDLPGTSCSL